MFYAYNKIGSLSAHKGLFRFTSLLDIISVIGIYRILNTIFIINTDFICCRRFIFTAVGILKNI